MRWLKIVGWVVAGLVILVAVVVGVVVGVFATGGGRITAWAIEHPISSYIGRKVTVKGPVEVHWGPPTRLVLNDLTIANADWGTAPDMLQSGQVEVQFYPGSLFHGARHFPLISIDHAKLLLETSQDGQRNWSFLDKLLQSNPRSQFPILNKLSIKDSELTFHNGTSGATTNLVAQDFTLNAPDPDGPVKIAFAGSLQNEPVKIAGTVGPLSQLRNPSKPYPVKLDGSIGESTLASDGTMGKPLGFSDLDVRVSLEGKKLHDIAAALDIPLPPLPDFRATGELTGGGGDWTLKALTAKVGASDLEGGIAIDMRGKVPYFRANLTSSRIDIADFTGFLGAKPAHSSAPPPAGAQAAEASGRIIPATPIAPGKLGNVNADVTLDGARVDASKGLPLQRVSAALHLKDGVLTLKPLRFGLADGEVAFDMTYDPGQKPPAVGLNMEIRRIDLHKLVANTAILAKFKDAAGIVGGYVHFKSAGTSLAEVLGHMNGRSALFMENGQLSQLLQELADLNILQALDLVVTGDRIVPINCFVGGFDMKDGVATAKTFALDTTDSMIVGSGNFNFAGETIYFDLRPYHKHFTLFTLRTPILVRGTFAKPSIALDKGNIVARVGEAVGLGILLPGVGALLPFIDTGLGTQNACSRSFALIK